MSRRCSECGADLLKVWCFCPKCGTPTPWSKYEIAEALENGELHEPYFRADEIAGRAYKYMLAARRDRGLSQAKLAQRAYLSKYVVRGAETGEHFPRLDTLIRMALALGVSLDEYVGFPEPEQEKPEPEPPEEQEPKMYIEFRDGKPVAYRYGPPWVAMQLYVEGGYPTEEEALAAWERYWKRLEGETK